MKKLKFKRPSDEMLKRDAEIFHQVEFSGVLPSPEDARDFVARSVNIFNLPDEYLAPDTEILNQSSIGSCVAHACAQAMSHYEQSNAGNHNDYSRGYILNGRILLMQVRKPKAFAHRCERRSQIQFDSVTSSI